MSDAAMNRRSVMNSFRIEEDFTNRQVYRVLCAAAVYVVLVTFVLCVFYTYVLNPIQIGKPSLLNLPHDFSVQWRESAELRVALQIWMVGMLGMTATFAVATGLVLSRKLAGPIYRLKTDLSRMRDGEPTFPIILRDNDELRDVAQILNDTLVAIEHRSTNQDSLVQADEEASASIDAIRAHLDELSSQPDPTDGLESWSARMRDLMDKAESACVR